MSVTIRPFDPANDFPRLETIRAAANRTDNDKQTVNSLPLTLVAVKDRKVIGYGATWHNPYWPPGELYLTVVVDGNHRSGGAGTALYARLLLHATETGFADLRSVVRDDCPEGLRFALRRGFAHARHQP